MRGIQSGKFALVLEILEVNPKRFLPFHEIRYEHPELLEMQAVPGKSAKHRVMPQPSGYTLDTSPEPPGETQSPATFSVPSIPILEKQRIKVRSIRRPRRTSKNAEPETAQETTDVVTKVIPTETQQLVSVSGSGIGGHRRAAEFFPQPSLVISVDPKDGLEKFAQAIRTIQDENPKVSMIWESHELTGKRGFAIVYGQTRKYVVVELRWADDQCCWMLEFGRPDDFSISTLLLTPKMEGATSQSKVMTGKLINEALHFQGGWHRKGVEDLVKTEQFQVSWAKHVDASPEHWGQRLYLKAWELVHGADKTKQP